MGQGRLVSLDAGMLRILRVDDIQGRESPRGCSACLWLEYSKQTDPGAADVQCLGAPGCWHLILNAHEAGDMVLFGLMLLQ